MTEEPIKISSLPERYGLTSKRGIYDRMYGLGIKPTKKGEISLADLDLLDKLHEFLKQNPRAAIADFQLPAEVEVQVPGMMLETVVDDKFETINWLSGLIEKLALRREVRSPLANYRELEEAANNDWILPSSVVAELVGATPHGEVFVRGSFTFSKAGRIGRARGWKVSKSGTHGRHLSGDKS